MGIVGYIYLITNLVDGKKYVGLTKLIEKRWVEHKSAAKRGVNYPLYRAMRKHGVENFAIASIEVVDGTQSDLFAAEIRQVAANDCLAPKGYNLTPGGEGVDYAIPGVLERCIDGARKRSASPEWQKNVAEAAKRRAKDPVCQEKLREGIRKRTEDPEWRKNVAEGARKRASNPEWQKNQAAAAQCRSLDPKWRRNVEDAARKRAANTEWRKNVAEGARKRSANPKWRLNVVEAAQKRVSDPVCRANLREGARKRVANPEWRKKNLDQIRLQHADPEWQRARNEGIRLSAARALAKSIARDADLPPLEQARRARRREQNRRYKAEKKLKSKVEVA